MSTAYLVLIILLVAYIPIWIWAWRRPEAAARWHLQKYGPCIMIKTQLGMRTMDRFARYKRFWHAFGFFSKIVSAVLFLMMMYMLIVAVIALPERLASGSSIGIEYALAIPGFNPILPLSYGVVALVVAMVVHELGHGIQARVNGMRVDSSGLLYGVVPLGAFVEPNEEDLRKADRKAQIDVYAAGITVNTIVAVLSIVLMLLCCSFVTTDHGSTPGVYSIDAESPAYDASIPTSSLIIGISDEEGHLLSGTDLTGTVSSDLTTTSSGNAASVDFDFDPTERYILTYLYHDETFQTEPVQMGAFVKTITKGSPADDADITAGTFLYSLTVDGVETAIGNPGDFTTFMKGTHGGQTVTVTTVSKMDDQGSYVMTSEEVVLTDRNGIGFFGVSTTTGGMTLTTPDFMMDRATDPFYNADSAYGMFTSFFSYLSGPFNGMDPISDDIRWWYDAPGGDLMWIVITMLYWLFWLDILLAISNALPTYVLDGGFIFAGGVSWLLEKLRIGDEERRRRMTDNIAGSISSVVLFLFVLVIISMVL